MATTRRTPRQQRARETVSHVLEAAAQIFALEGLRATTNRIAARAGVSIGTLYQYFPDKLALLVEPTERHLRLLDADLERTFARVRAEELSPQTALVEIVETVVDGHADHPALYALMERFTPRLPAGVAFVDSLRERCASEVAYHLARHQPHLASAEVLARARVAVHAVDAQIHRDPLADRNEQLRRALDTGTALLGLPLSNT